MTETIQQGSGRPRMSITRVLLVGDFARYQETVGAMLRVSRDLEVVGEAADGLEAGRLT